MTKKSDENRQTTAERAYQKAQQLLKIRPHTVYELLSKLKRAGFDKLASDSAVLELSKQGYLNDRSFAENFLDSLIKYKTFGFYAVRAKLLKRGIDRSLVDELLADHFDIGTEQGIAEKLLARSKSDDVRKLAARLASRGFRSEIIARILKVAPGG